MVNDPPIDSTILHQLAGNIGMTAQEVDQISASSAEHQQLGKRLIDRYGTGRVMFKTTRRMVSGFPGRRVLMLPLGEETSAEGIRRRINREVLQDCGLETAPSAIRFDDDPRLAWLEGFLRAHRQEKILLICRTAEKVKALHTALGKRINAKIGQYHDGMTLVQRDRNAAWFSEPDGAVLLLCSEIGSEGRNFQFARHLVLFDLPPDPELLEQRIGRLDRIGQSGVVQVLVPYVRGTASEILARWYDEALDALGHSRPAAGWVMRRCFGPLSALMGDPCGGTSGTRLDRLIRCGRLALARQQRRVETGRDRLLELDSLADQRSDRLIADIRDTDADPAFPDLAEQLLDAWGIVMDPIAPTVFRLNPDHRYADALPGFRPSGLTVTTERALALTREDLDFLTADHPLITGAMEQFLGTGKGNAAFACLSATESQKLFLEMMFVIEAAGLADPQMRSFLPPTPLRVIVDQALEDGLGGLPDQDLNRLTDGPSSLWSRILPAVSRLIPQMVAAGRRMAREKSEAIIAEARQTARQRLEEAVGRLEALRRVNPTITDQDIADANQALSTALTAIDTARVRLDALRLVLKGPIDAIGDNA